MVFVVGKNGSNTRKKAQWRSGATFQSSDAVVDHFCHNPMGEALFAIHFVAALARMNNYATQGIASWNGQKSLSQKLINICLQSLRYS